MNKLLFVGGASLVVVLVGCGDEFETQDALPESEGYDDHGPSLIDPGKADSTAGIPAYAALSDIMDLDGTAFEVLFAPGDPVNTVEAALIDSVAAARAQDPAEYADGDNPFRIRYAVYNLRNPILVGHLIDAFERGVDVQILMEEDQLDPAKDWNTADEMLVEAGFEFVPNHRDLTDKNVETADLIGIKSSGLMHLKARIFETPSSAVLLSGSLNPGDNAMLNDETLHVIRDQRLVAVYNGAFEAVRAGRSGIDNTWDDDAPVNALFAPVGTGPRASARILEWLAEEDELILLMTYSLRDIGAPTVSRSLVDILSDKAAAGVPVYVITDRKQSDGVDADGNHVAFDDPTEDRLRSGGVHVYEATNYASPFNAMHHKAAILGLSDTRVITDTANWTKAGLGSASQRAKNIESVLFIDSVKLDDGRTGRRYLAEWLDVLRRYADQSKGDGEASFPEVFGELVSRSDWPHQPVVFSVLEAQTSWGENVFVRGDTPELGLWGGDHTGVQLSTDAETYPDWLSAEVTMTLGSTFEWKAVAGRPESRMVRWEAGDNRRTFVTPSALVGAEFGEGGPCVARGPWR